MGSCLSKCCSILWFSALTVPWKVASCTVVNSFLGTDALQIFRRPAGNLPGGCSDHTHPLAKALSGFPFCFHETSGRPSTVPPLLSPFYSVPVLTVSPLLNVLQRGGKLRKDFKFLCNAFYPTMQWDGLAQNSRRVQADAPCILHCTASPHTTTPATSSSQLFFCPDSLPPSLPGFCSFSLE